MCKLNALSHISHLTLQTYLVKFCRLVNSVPNLPIALSVQFGLIAYLSQYVVILLWHRRFCSHSSCIPGFILRLVLWFHVQFQGLRGDHFTHTVVLLFDHKQYNLILWHWIRVQGQYLTCTVVVQKLWRRKKWRLDG